MALFDEVMLLHIFTHPSSELFVLGMLGMHIDVAISDFASNPKDIYVILSVIGYPITIQSLFVFLSPLPGQ
jgi:hypothetical protein